MPIVFVHGVNVRHDEKYIRETKQRDEHFANILFPLLGRELPADRIINLFWGDLATNLSPGLPFIPARPPLPHQVMSQKISSNHASLLQLARRRPITEVFDLMLARSYETSDGEEPESVSRLGYFLLRFGKRFKSLDEQFDWLSSMNDDVEFLARVEAEIEREEGGQGAKDAQRLKHLSNSMSWLKKRYGGARERARNNLQTARLRLRADIAKVKTRARGDLKAVARSSRSAATAVTATTLTHPLRKIFHDHMFYFIGDAFMYFGQRGTPESPGPIVKRLSDAVASARTLIVPEDPELIVIGHSMGGNIVCDFVSHFEPKTQIDLLITVGSQFPLFADLQMFPGLGTARPFEKPPSVKRWINIYDMNDVFGFAAEPLFAGVEDRHYASGKMGITTHADCFKFISLYEHMAQSILATPKR